MSTPNVLKDKNMVNAFVFIGGNEVNYASLELHQTSPKGASPGYPNGYIKYENSSGQGVDPYTGRTLPNSQSHYGIN